MKAKSLWNGSFGIAQVDDGVVLYTIDRDNRTAYATPVTGILPTSSDKPSGSLSFEQIDSFRNLIAEQASEMNVNIDSDRIEFTQPSHAGRLEETLPVLQQAFRSMR